MTALLLNHFSDYLRASGCYSFIKKLYFCFFPSALAEKKEAGNRALRESVSASRAPSEFFVLTFLFS